jgi:hypothetical protein
LSRATSSLRVGKVLQLYLNLALAQFTTHPEISNWLYIKLFCSVNCD